MHAMPDKDRSAGCPTRCTLSPYGSAPLAASTLPELRSKKNWTGSAHGKRLGTLWRLFQRPLDVTSTSPGPISDNRIRDQVMACIDPLHLIFAAVSEPVSPSLVLTESIETIIVAGKG